MGCGVPLVKSLLIGSSTVIPNTEGGIPVTRRRLAGLLFPLSELRLCLPHVSWLLCISLDILVLDFYSLLCHSMPTEHFWIFSIRAVKITILYQPEVSLFYIHTGKIASSLVTPLPTFPLNLLKSPDKAK